MYGETKQLWAHANNQVLKVCELFHKIIPFKSPKLQQYSMTKPTPDADS